MSGASSSQGAASPPAVDQTAPPSKKYPWSLLVALTWVFIGFAALPVVASIIITVIPAVLGWGPARSDAWLQDSQVSNFLYILLSSVMTLSGLAWFVTHHKIAFRQVMGLSRPQMRDLGHIIGGVLLYFALFIVAVTLIGHVVPINTEQEQAIGFERGTVGIGLVLAFIGLVVIPPLAEEMIFRGFLYGTLRSHHLRAFRATLITSVVFASLHLFGATDGNLLWIAFLDTFVLSLVLCYLREKTGSIWASVGVHALKNGFVFTNLFIINVV